MLKLKLVLLVVITSVLTACAGAEDDAVPTIIGTSDIACRDVAGKDTVCK